METDEYDDGQSQNRFNTEGISFKEIAMSQLKKIGTNANVEFLGGYWQSKVIPMQGGTTKVKEEYIPDSREIYCNSIEYMHDILAPHFQDNKRMKTASEKYKTTISKLLEQYMKDGKFTDEEKLEFRKKKIVLCRELFVELNFYLFKRRYLEIGSIED